MQEIVFVDSQEGLLSSRGGGEGGGADILAPGLQKYKNKIILISKDSESIEGDPIIIEYIFTVVTTNYILLYDMINIMFLNMMVSF